MAREGGRLLRCAAVDALWERRTFRGSATTVASFRDDFVGDTRFSGCVAFVRWPRAAVESVLAPALELAPAVGGPLVDHPVAFVFGHQRRGAIMYAGFRLPMNVAFGEFALAIPFVRHRGGDALCTYVPRMLSSYFPAVWDGCIRYGYRKTLATMEWSGDTFLMSDESEGLLFHALRDATGAWADGRDADTLLAPLRDAFMLPILGCKSDGRLVGAYWSWGFDEASVRPAAAHVAVERPLLPNAPVAAWHSELTVEVRAMQWQLSLPFRCRP